MLFDFTEEKKQIEFENLREEHEGIGGIYERHLKAPQAQQGWGVRPETAERDATLLCDGDQGFYWDQDHRTEPEPSPTKTSSRTGPSLRSLTEVTSVRFCE